MWTRCFAVAAAIAISSSGVVSRAADATENGPEGGVVIRTRVTSAALFKNGFAFIQREGEVGPGVTRARLDSLPAPVHGTLWVAADPDRLRLDSAVARRSAVREIVPAASIEQILHANVGREMTLYLKGGERWSGTLVKIIEAGSHDEDQRPRSVSPSRVLGVPGTPPGLLLLETESGSLALNTRDVSHVVSDRGPLIDRVEGRREALALELSLTRGDETDAAISVHYLTRGLTWAPSYAIDITDSAAAVLNAKAEVINEAEDLEGATLQFVTGFPNLQFAHVVDPMALRGDMDAFLDALGRRDAPMRHGVMQQVVMNLPQSGSSSFPAPGEPPAGAAVEDLFLYERERVTLMRGERGLYPLFSHRVPYEHLYEWEIADRVEGQRVRQEGQPAQEEIWHSVRLRNDTGQPWSTAPAITLRDGHLLGQDTLTYAAVGASTTVRITRAVDVQGDETEYEIARERDAVHFHNRSYDKVTVGGRLRASNHKREPIRLEIRKQVQGEVTGNPDDAEIVAITEGLRKVNPSTRLTWSVPLEAGAMAEIGYEYTLYVRP